MMELRLLLKQSILPPSVFYGLLVLAFLLRKRMPRTAVGIFFSSIIALVVLSMPISTHYLAHKVETVKAIHPQAWQNLAEQADAIVIISGGREGLDPAWGEEPVGYLAAERVRYGARLAKASGLPILLSGGIPYEGALSEATIMASSLEKDFSVSAQWLEEKSRTTWENAILSHNILAAEGINRIVLITNAWHMPRSQWSFERQGFEVIPAPVGFFSAPKYRPLGGFVPNSQSLWKSTLLIHELLGQYSYKRLY